MENHKDKTSLWKTIFLILGTRREGISTLQHLLDGGKFN